MHTYAYIHIRICIRTPGTVERLKRSGEALLMREGPQDSIVLRFGVYAFDDPRPRPPSTVTPSSLGFTSSANGNRKEKEEQVLNLLVQQYKH